MARTLYAVMRRPGARFQPSWRICAYTLTECTPRCIGHVFGTMIVAGSFFFLLCLIIIPGDVIYVVIDTSLTQFNYTNNTLHHNLTFSMATRNSNGRLGFYYDNIEARALYQGSMFESDKLTPFYQHPKSIDYLSHTFQGQQLLKLSPKKISEYNKEKSDGVYNIDVNLYLKLRAKIGFLKTKIESKVKCRLKVPLRTDSTTSGTAFEPTKCDSYYF